jgi:hypothetical protein
LNFKKWILLGSLSASLMVISPSAFADSAPSTPSAQSDPNAQSDPHAPCSRTTRSLGWCEHCTYAMGCVYVPCIK